MSEHITHLAICDDALRLASRHDAIPDLFKQLMRDKPDVAHLGATTRTADNWSAEVLAAARDTLKKPEKARDPLAADKIIFVLGALTHRSADRLMKPIIRAFPEPAEVGYEVPNKRECTVYHDIHSFREVYGGGEGENAWPFDPKVVQPPSTEAEAAYQRFMVISFRRALIQMHTFAPDNSDAPAWLDKFLGAAKQQAFHIPLRIYEAAARDWDPAKVHMYITNPNFYDANDPLIRLTREIQRGRNVQHAQIDQALDQIGEQHSRYARALAKAMDYLLAAAELFHGDIDTDTARERFDVGVPELSIKWER